MASRHNWDDILLKVKQQLDDGTAPTFAALSRQLNINVSVLSQGLKNNFGITAANLMSWWKDSDDEISYHALFSLIHRKPKTLIELSNYFNRSPKTILDTVKKMQKNGYVIEQMGAKIGMRASGKIDHSFSVETETSQKTIGDQPYTELLFGVFSDTHFSSRFAQISNWLHYMRTAYEEGVRVFFFVGDLTAGMGGYRGQNMTLLPGHGSSDRTQNWLATKVQIKQAQIYWELFEHHSDCEFYMIGGNHDFWHWVNSGIDSVAQFCDMYENVHYLGYDAADISLNNMASIRLWHPTGGVPYSISYRLQKGVEAFAAENLQNDVGTVDNPAVRFFFAGHLHIEVKTEIGPITAAQVGCFEGQTEYLKKKGLVPSIGGQIWKARLTEDGDVARTEYAYIKYREITDDWRNYPIASAYDNVGREADKLLITLEGIEQPQK